MYLIIDPGSDQKISYYLFDQSTFGETTKKTRSSNFLCELDNFLTQKKLEAVDLEGVGVVVGQGRFTATRIAVVIANLFGYEFDLPLLGLESFSRDNRRDIIHRFQTQSDCKYISAEYSGEPNIN